MKPYKTPNHPPGEIVYCSTGYARCESFFRSLHMLEVPDGTHVANSTGTGIASMMNGLMHGLQAEAKWVFILGDDHEFRPDLVKRMLIRAELYQTPIMVPLVCKKLPPFDSVLFSQDKKPLDFMDIKGDDPLPVWAAGSAGMLIQRHVIDKMGHPWFKIGWGAPDASDEDVYFCRRAAECGFQTYVDPTLSMSHIPAEVFVSPKRFPNGEWFVEFRWPDSRAFSIPMQRPIR